MEEHKALQHILKHSAEGAPDDFTNAVMKMIQHRAATTLYNQPLVPPKLVKGFLVAAAVLVAFIFILSFVISFPSFPFLNALAERLAEVPLSAKAWNQILMFVLCFWFVFGINRFIEKRNGYAAT